MALVVPIIARAQGLVPCTDNCTWEQLGTLVRNVFKFALFDLAIPIAVVMFVWAGFEMMTAGGDEGKFKEGRKRMTGVAIGLVIAFCAYLIVQTIINFITGTSGEWF